uniref:NADPH--hemoprotein reductase n=2 Tax=Leptocylindrus danicus TaxID=163516 RepID=A0A7S2K3Q5_9STRA
METPIIMVGAGTGLAPLMGFLEDRALSLASVGGDNTKKAAPCHLIFGCRSNRDRLYSEKISGWESNGVLQLHLALSRHVAVPKMYVQDKLKELGAELCELLMREDTQYFICGDAKMADSCYESCVKVLQKYGNLSRVAAVQRLIQMRIQHRYHYDLWGVTSQFSNDFLGSNRKRRSQKGREDANAWMGRYVTSRYSGEALEDSIHS